MQPQVDQEAISQQREDGVTRNCLLPPGPTNPRNSEGDFIELRDGRVLFVYTHFTGGRGDHATAYLAGRYSRDGGLTWTDEDVTILPNEGGMNIMSVSVLRLQNGEIALFYLKKNATDDCRPCMRISTDECATWSEPILCVQPGGYYVLNNDRVIQTQEGRLVMPVALHSKPGGPYAQDAAISCFMSDDNGKTWRQSETVLTGRIGDKQIRLQEPGVVELKSGRLMMFMRTTSGCQYISFSEDRAETWSPIEPSNILSPCSPASIERIPSTGDLLLVWNDHTDIDPELKEKRTPYTAAISRDEGKTWENVKTLEDDSNGWYCYTAIEFVGDRVLLAHCSGQREQALAMTQITSFKVTWLYE